MAAPPWRGVRACRGARGTDELRVPQFGGQLGGQRLPAASTRPRNRGAKAMPRTHHGRRSATAPRAGSASGRRRPSGAPCSRGWALVCETCPHVCRTPPRVCESTPLVCEASPRVYGTRPLVCRTAPLVWRTRPLVCRTAPLVCGTRPLVCGTPALVRGRRPRVLETRPRVLETRPRVLETRPRVLETRPRVFGRRCFGSQKSTPGRGGRGNWRHDRMQQRHRTAAHG